MEMGVTDEILVKFKKDVSQKEIDKIHKKYNTKIIKTTDIYQLLKVPMGADGLQIANKYQESGLTRFSHPNFISEIELHQTIPNDPYFNNQFSLNNTGQVFTDGHYGTNDADIDAPEAWDVTKGNNDIIIAVLDQGLTSNHPDLPNTRQVRLNGSNFGDGDDNNPSPTYNGNHGNACAGIIGATQNNNLGIAGIAPNCKIMPIRIFNSDNSGISPHKIADAIKFAWENGADVISNSWGYNSENPNLYPVIKDAIIDATTKGRNNLGCVVAFSAGNNLSSSGYVHFPSNVNVAGVLTVGASDRYDQKSYYSPLANPSSPNNQFIDLVAPSHRAYSNQIATETFEAWSIDIPGDAGYNPVKNTDGGTLPTIGSILPNSGTNNLSYTGRFGGTSYSCPQVAAVAALVLSVNPNLTQQEIFGIVTNTADEVGGYSYTNGRSNELGFGRLNAANAVREAIFSNVSINGNNIICTSATAISITNLPPNTSVSWTSSSNISFPSGNTGASVSAQASSYAASGDGWIEATLTTSNGSFTLRRKIIDWVGRTKVPNYSVVSKRVTALPDPISMGNCDDIAIKLNISPANYDEVIWERISSNYTISEKGNQYAILAPFSKGDLKFRIRVENQCGLSNWIYHNVDNNCYSGGFFSVYANPANQYAELNFYKDNELSEYQRSSPTMVNIPLNEQTQEQEEYEIQIWNERKGLVKKIKSKDKKLQIPTNNLDEGLYFLHVIINGQVYKQQLRVKR